MTDLAAGATELDLQSAIEQWCDQTLVGEERRLREMGYTSQTMAAILGKETPGDRATDPLCCVVDKLHSELHYKLLDGELIGAGYLSGDLPEMPRRDVHPNRWSVLRIDFDKWSAEGSGIVLNDLRIRVGETTAVEWESEKPGLVSGQNHAVVPQVQFKIIKSRHQVEIDGKVCTVPNTPFRFLCLLVEHLNGSNEPLSVREIAKVIYSNNAPPNGPYELASTLRKRFDGLSSGAGKRIIRTVHGAGFVLALGRDQISIE